MKSIGPFFLILVIGLVAIGFWGINLSSKVDIAAAALASANDKIARLERRLASSEQAERDLTAENERLRALAETRLTMPLQLQQANSPGAPSPTTSVYTAPTSTLGQALSEREGTSTAATLTINPASLADFDAPGFFAGQGPAAPQDLAKATITVVSTAQQYGAYLENHPFMNSQLGSLHATAEKILADDGTDPVATAALKSKLAGTLTAAGLNFANLAKGMKSDSPEVLQQSLELQKMVNLIKSRQEPAQR